MQSYQEGGFIITSLQAEILQNSQEGGFLNENYRQRYCKFLKAWNLKTKSAGRNIAKFSRGGIYKTEIQAEILQMFQEVKFYKPGS